MDGASSLCLRDTALVTRAHRSVVSRAPVTVTDTAAGLKGSP